MTNLEFYKDKINMGSSFCAVAYICKYGRYCVRDSYATCSKCEFKRDGNACIKAFLAEHKEPIKLKQWEKDLISLFDKGYSKDYSFSLFLSLNGLKEKGHFKGITDTSMKIEDILKNCEVIK